MEEGVKTSSEKKRGRLFDPGDEKFHMGKVFLLLCFCMMALPEVAWGDFRVWKVAKSGKRVIIEMDKDEVLTSKDRLHLQNDQGKCWIQVMKVKPPYALASTGECLFPIEKGNLLVHSQYFSTLSSSPEEEPVLEEEDLSVEQKRAQEPVVLPRVRAKKSYSFHSLASLGYFPFDQLSFDHPNLDEDVSIERTFSLRSDTTFRRPSWKNFGIGGGFSYDFEREIGLPGNPSFSLFSLHTNLAYFLRKDLYFHGGANISIPLSLEKYLGASDFESFPGFGFQLGATFLLGKIAGVTLEYKRSQFFSTQNEVDSSSETGKKKSVGTYTIDGFGISFGFSFF